MAILTTISDIPLFSKKSEALTWAFENGLDGYHTHVFNNQIGYMGGYNHAQATGAPQVPAPPPPTNNNNGSNVTSGNNSGNVGGNVYYSGGGSSGGGGGGY